MSDRPDLVGYFAPPTLSQIWRTLIELLWRIEHAFERSRERNRAVDDTRVRIFGILILFSMLFAGLAVKAGAVALFSRVGSGVESATVSLSRADLVDRNGRTLALDAPLYGVYVDGREIWDAKEAVNAMSTVLPRESAQKVAHAVALRRIELIQSGLTREQRDRIHDLGIVGVTFQDEARRAYPLDRQAAHFVGWSDSQGHGVAGAEKALDAEIRDAAPGGGHIPLSIDLRVQAALESELKRAMVDYQAVNAIGVVTNIQTGEVLALANAPDFDPNHVGAFDQAVVTNRAGISTYEMGSTFKMFTFAMALNERVANLDTVIDTTSPLFIGTRQIHDAHPAPRNLTMAEVFLESSNVGTVRLMRRAGSQRLHDYLKRFGMLDRAKIELNESARPQAPREWTEDVSASAAFGHNIAVTPLAVAQGVGGLMNGGRLIPLTVRRQVADRPVTGEQIISPETSATMLKLMRKNAVDGTGRHAEVEAPGYRIGGKTGTAEKVVQGQISRKRLFTSFAAVFPTDGPLNGPRYLVLVLLDEPKPTPASSGGTQAAWNATPTAGRVINRIAPMLGVKRDLSAAFVAKAPAKPLVDDVSTTDQ